MIPGTDFAYVKITQFAADTGNELEAALQEIDNAKSQGVAVQGLVLDLRNNPGGFLREAIRVSSQFLRPGTVVLQEEDADGNIQKYKSRGWGQARKIPTVVLINQGTASAAEITAGALQENGRAQLVGQTTFGTGTVLNQFNLSDGSAILLGVTNWLTPSGKLIKGQGIEPDVPVEQATSVELVDARSLREMSADELDAVEDLQFLTGLDVLRQEAPGMQQANTAPSGKSILEYLPSIPWQLRFRLH
jgi:carboxyl-terminal processing protease